MKRGIVLLCTVLVILLAACGASVSREPNNLPSKSVGDSLHNISDTINTITESQLITKLPGLVTYDKDVLALFMLDAYNDSSIGLTEEILYDALYSYENNQFVPLIVDDWFRRDNDLIRIHLANTDCYFMYYPEFDECEIYNYYGCDFRCVYFTNGVPDSSFSALIYNTIYDEEDESTLDIPWWVKSDYIQGDDSIIIYWDGGEREYKLKTNFDLHVYITDDDYDRWLSAMEPDVAMQFTLQNISAAMYEAGFDSSWPALNIDSCSKWNDGEMYWLYNENSNFCVAYKPSTNTWSVENRWHVDTPYVYFYNGAPLDQYILGQIIRGIQNDMPNWKKPPVWLWTGYEEGDTELTLWDLDGTVNLTIKLEQGEAHG